MVQEAHATRVPEVQRMPVREAPLTTVPAAVVIPALAVRPMRVLVVPDTMVRVARGTTAQAAPPTRVRAGLLTLVQVGRVMGVRAVRVTTVPGVEANVPSYVSDGWGLSAPRRDPSDSPRITQPFGPCRRKESVGIHIQSATRVEGPVT